MSQEDTFDERAANLMENLGVTGMAARKLIVDALRRAFEDGRQEADDAWDPLDE